MNDQAAGDVWLALAVAKTEHAPVVFSFLTVSGQAPTVAIRHPGL